VDIHIIGRGVSHVHGISEVIEYFRLFKTRLYNGLKSVGAKDDMDML
jgi:hypothetical protein